MIAVARISENFSPIKERVMMTARTGITKSFKLSAKPGRNKPIKTANKNIKEEFWRRFIFITTKTVKKFLEYKNHFSVDWAVNKGKETKTRSKTKKKFFQSKFFKKLKNEKTSFTIGLMMLYLFFGLVVPKMLARLIYCVIFHPLLLLECHLLIF